MSFMAKIAAFCIDINHHPRWENIYRTVRINLSTWDTGDRPSQTDLILALRSTRLTESSKAPRRSALTRFADSVHPYLPTRTTVAAADR